MDPLLDLAVACGRLSRLDATEVADRIERTGVSSEELLHAGGLLDPEEYDWLATMSLQGYGEEELASFRQQWALARVMWSQRLFPPGQEALPRQLLRWWSQRRTLGLAELLAEAGADPGCVAEALRRLEAELEVCPACHLVVTEAAPSCPNCGLGLSGRHARPAPASAGPLGPYDLLPAPQPAGLGGAAELSQALTRWVETRAFGRPR